MRIKTFAYRQSSLIVALLAVLLALCAARRAAAGIADGVKYTKLANGLQVIILENHKSPVATFNVFYRVGSRNEQFGKTGISHLCEHLMFRGTKKLAPEEFSNIIQENGGDDNAFTSNDFTDYFEIINRDHLDVPIGLEADRMANFEPKGFDSEKAVVMEERRLRTEDSPEDALQEMTEAAAFVAHPYHWPVIGWMHEIEGLTLQDAMAYHAIYYSPQNAIIVAVGDFNGDEVIKRIRQAFGSIKNNAKPPPVTEVEPPQEGERRVTLRHAANLPAFNEAYHAANYRDLSDAFALEIASEVLSDGKSSRLYKDLVVDKQSVVDVSAEYDMTFVRSGPVLGLGADAARGEDGGRGGGNRQADCVVARHSGHGGGAAAGEEPGAIGLRLRTGLDFPRGRTARGLPDAGRLPHDRRLPERDRQGDGSRHSARGQEIPG